MREGDYGRASPLQSETWTLGSKMRGTRRVATYTDAWDAKIARCAISKSFHIHRLARAHSS